jgi:hypothetical protein
VAPVDEFLQSVPALNEAFRSWAASVAGDAPTTERGLEMFCVRYGSAIRPGTPLFRQLVAAYGELVRQAAGGRWSKSSWLYPDEPVVIPRLSVAARPVLREAYELLETSGDLTYV